MRKCLLGLLFLWVTVVDGNSQDLAGGAPDGFLSSGAYSNLKQGLFAFTCNQATLGELPQGGIALSASRPFILEGLNHAELGAVINGGPGHFGFLIMYDGSADHSETLGAMAYGMKLSKVVDVGLQFSYLGAQTRTTSGTIRGGEVRMEGAVLMHLTQKLNAGWQVGQAPGSRRRRYSPAPGSVYSFGVGYDATDQWSCSIEMIRYSTEPFNARLGFIYQVSTDIILRAGFCTTAIPWWLGCSLNRKSYAIDLGMSVHPQLGATPAVGFRKMFNARL